MSKYPIVGIGFDKRRIVYDVNLNGSIIGELVKVGSDKWRLRLHADDPHDRSLLNFALTTSWDDATSAQAEIVAKINELTENVRRKAVTDYARSHT